MIILNKKKNKLDIVKKHLKKIPISLYLLIVLIAIAIPVYYYILNLPKPSLEDQMKEYSKQVTAPQMSIDIKFENYQKLLYQRRQALRSGGDDISNKYIDFEEIPAKITYKGIEYKAGISLKGLRKLHYSDSTKMSFQVKLKGDHTIMGMNKFSLHDPKMRNYIYEWIFHELLRKEGFIALKYDFIQVRLNGMDAGVYAIEERPDKILLERYGYAEGPIFKISDDKDSLFTNTIEPFNDKKYKSDEWKAITEKANILAKGIYEGRFKFGQIVNSDMFAKYFAICDVLMNYHGFLSKSVRFYFNPVTEKFEPIGFDGHIDTEALNFISSEIMQRINYITSYFYAIVLFQDLLFFNEEFYDRDFLTAYAKYLYKFSSVKYLDTFFSDISDELTQKMTVIYKNQPLLKDHINSYGPDEFRYSRYNVNAQAKYIRDLLGFRLKIAGSLVSAKIDSSTFGKRSFELMVSNNYAFSLILVEAVFNDSIKFNPEGNDFIIPHKFFNVRNYKKFNFLGASELPNEIKSAKLGFKIAGVDIIHYVDIELFQDIYKKVMSDFIRSEDNLDEFSDILSIILKSNTIKFKTGKHIINKLIKIPKGYKVIIDEGIEINLKDSAFILSYSPLYFNGSVSNPIKILSDKTGGIAVFDCDSTSYLKNVIFDGLSNPHCEEWKLTGSVTFYKSPVIIDNVEFNNNSSEDYLNIKLTKFDILNSKFKNISSDAFDSDFSNGRIINTVFENMINDAIDVSGSEVFCKYIAIKNAGDKGFSSGEASLINIENAKISDSEIAIASKDKSKIIAEDLEIVDCKVGFAAYQKKSEYGPGEIVIEKYKINRCQKEYLIEINSSLMLDNKMINGDLINVGDDYLYGKEYGKKSVR